MFVETFDINDSAGKYAVHGIVVKGTHKKLPVGHSWDIPVKALPEHLREDYNNVMLVPTDERGVYEFILPEMELGPVT
jgi:hypothetical protein